MDENDQQVRREIDSLLAIYLSLALTSTCGGSLLLYRVWSCPRSFRLVISIQVLDFRVIPLLEAAYMHD